MGPPLGLNSIIFLKQRINYSASRASEHGMLGPSATPQDVCIPVNMQQGPIAQNFRNADAYQRYFLKGFCCRWLGWGGGQQVFGVKLLRKSSMNFLADDPANCSAGQGMSARVQGQRWHGQVTSRILRQPALAPALAVKIDAAPFQKFDPLPKSS